MSNERTEAIEKFQKKCLQHDQDLHDQRVFWRKALMFGCDVPYDAYRGTQYHNIAQHHTNDETNEWELDVEATQKEIARYIRLAMENDWEVEKKYDDSDINIYIEVPDVKGKFNIYSTRQVVCKRVQTGTRIVEAVEEHEEPIYEYQCDKVAFLKIEI